MDEKDMLLRKIRSTDFAMWELHIFLDSHPDNADALALMQKYTDKRDVLVAEYEKKYGPLNMRSVTNANRWQWINDPWPWEISEEDNNHVGV